MARKTYVDLSDTIEAWRVKTNLISSSVGDLDSLAAALPDSDLVHAINYVYEENIRDIKFDILKSDGSLVKRVFGYTDSGV